jgi:small subunit ribosomal protein S16
MAGLFHYDSARDDRRGGWRLSSAMVKIRLMRMGMKGAPSYRVVVADARSPRDGRIIENIGWYNPLTEPSSINIKPERARYWLGVGAQPSDSVRSLLIRAGVVENPTTTDAETATPPAPKAAKASK